VKIVVCAKQVPSVDTNVVVSGTEYAVEESNPSFQINNSDEYAIEEGIALKQKLRGEVSVVTVGSVRSQELLYMALAKGADSCFRIDAAARTFDSTAKILAAFLKGREFDLVITGLESSDGMWGATGVYLASLLGVPFVSFVTKVEPAPDGTMLRVEREFFDGSQEIMEVSPPVVLCVQSGIAQLRFVPYLKMLQARRQPIKTVSLGELGLREDALKPRFSTVESFLPAGKKKTHFMTGDPQAIADELLSKIKLALV
jgi:electron transfer flavoprotein beta subunit